MTSAPQAVVVPVSDGLPPVEHRVIIVCKGSRCLGYRDREGVWRDNARQRELQDVIGWTEIWSNGTAENTISPQAP